MIKVIFMHYDRNPPGPDELHCEVAPYWATTIYHMIRQS